MSLAWGAKSVKRIRRAGGLALSMTKICGQTRGLPGRPSSASGEQRTRHRASSFTGLAQNKRDWQTNASAAESAFSSVCPPSCPRLTHIKHGCIGTSRHSRQRRQRRECIVSLPSPSPEATEIDETIPFQSCGRSHAGSKHNSWIPFERSSRGRPGHVITATFGRKGGEKAS